MYHSFMYHQLSILETKYPLVVTRIQEDNSIELLLNSLYFENSMPLVLVGNWVNTLLTVPIYL
jgi:hypothetical protein